MALNWIAPHPDAMLVPIGGGVVLKIFRERNGFTLNRQERGDLIEIGYYSLLSEAKAAAEKVTP